MNAQWPKRQTPQIAKTDKRDKRRLCPHGTAGSTADGGGRPELVGTSHIFECLAAAKGAALVDARSHLAAQLAETWPTHSLFLGVGVWQRSSPAWPRRTTAFTHTLTPARTGSGSWLLLALNEDRLSG